MPVLMCGFALPRQAQRCAAAQKGKQQNDSQRIRAYLAMNVEFTEMLITELVASGLQVNEG